jgi:D-alanyl-lipoteichoic acid acyltransferase DltB (MBOAT superfamily)
VRSALFLILLGLFKKVVIADGIGQYVDTAFAHADSAGSLALLLGAYGFVLQIYGDFSGYSDIARGSARLFGVELLRNFDQPFLSRTISEFWRRWQIVTNFHVLILTGVFFRADSLTQAAHYIAGLFSFRSGVLLGDYAGAILVAMLASFTIDILQRSANSETAILRWSAVPRGVAFAALGIPIIIFSGGSPVPFIYFQF